jgi:hypothetical protein
MISNHVPYLAPLDTDPAHVVVTDLNNLLQGKHPVCHRVVELFAANLAQSVRKINCTCYRYKLQTRM